MMQTVLNDLWLVMPIVLVSLGSLVLLLIEAFAGKNWPRAMFTTLVLLVCVPYVLSAGESAPVGGTVFSGLVYGDAYTHFLYFVLILGSILATLAGKYRLRSLGIQFTGEYYALLLMCTAGAMIFVAAAELITLFLGLELMSMALYCLCGSARDSEKATEAALKYFLLGSFSSAFMLYGMAFLYGITGTTMIPELMTGLQNDQSGLALVGMGLLLLGFVFKLALVPFHFWAPDVYEGAPTPVTAYMACVIKTAAAGAALRVIWTAFGDYSEDWSGALWLVAVLTMIVANVVALRQNDVKRMLAYSSVGHAGYIVMAFMAPGEAYGAAAVLYYLLAYTIMTMGAFAVLLSFQSGDGLEEGSHPISHFYGLASSHPFIAAMMALFMFSLAGIPPGMAGMLGKFYVFNAAVQAGFVGLAIIGVLSAAISCYYYLRVIVAMYFMKAEGEVAAIDTDASLMFVLLICALGVILLGVFPSMLHAGAMAVTRGM